MIDINSIIRDAEKYSECVKTELYMPSVNSFLAALGKRYGGSFKRNECEPVFRSLKVDAEKQDAQALYELGLCYYLGLGVQRNFEEAARAFHSAAERKQVDAISALGVCYMEGRGVEYSPGKALKMFKLGAKFQGAVALYNLGLCYYYGYGCEEDRKAGYHYLQESAKLGFGEAYNVVG